jgi:hypothetical protein
MFKIKLPDSGLVLSLELKTLVVLNTTNLGISKPRLNEQSYCGIALSLNSYKLLF